MTEKLMARIFFCSVPGFLVAAPVGLLSNSIWLSVLIFIAMFIFGLQITQPRPERGER